MFALLFSYFINKVNLIAIECLDFAVKGLHCLKKLFDYKNRIVRHRKKVELCGVKLSSSYKMPLVIIKKSKIESVIKAYHA